MAHRLDHLLYALEKRREPDEDNNLAVLVDGKGATIEDDLLELTDLSTWTDVLSLVVDTYDEEIALKLGEAIYGWAMRVVSSFRRRIMHILQDPVVQLLKLGGGGDMNAKSEARKETKPKHIQSTHF